MKTPKPFLIVGALLIALVFAGCMALPAWLRPSTPIEKAEKRDKQQAAAREDVIAKTQEAIHKADVALSQAEPSRAVDVAKDYVSEAKTLVDQAKGAPTATDAAAWKALVMALLSENEKVRAAAEQQRRGDAMAVALASDLLAQRTIEKAAAEARVREYAKENEGYRNLVLKIKWVVGILLGLWLLGQILSVASRFNPAFGAAAGFVNGIAAPAVQYTLQRAAKGIKSIGEGMKEARKRLPAAAEQVADILDTKVDNEHQAIIGVIANPQAKA